MPAMPDRSDQDSAAPDRRPGRHRPDRVSNHRSAWWHPVPPVERAEYRHLAAPQQEDVT